MSKKLRILVCGGREYSDRGAMFSALDAVQRKRGIACLIHGKAPGADSLADEWAETRGVERERYPAKWDEHGRRAGPIRNAQMLREGKPDAVVAFPGGAGTANMVYLAKAAHLPVWEIS